MRDFFSTMTIDYDYDSFYKVFSFIAFVQAVIVIVTSHSLEVSKSKK